MERKLYEIGHHFSQLRAVDVRAQSSVPRSTLQDRLSGRVAVGAKPGSKPLLDSSLEDKLINYASNRAKLGIGC